MTRPVMRSAHRKRSLLAYYSIFAASVISSAASRQKASLLCVPRARQLLMRCCGFLKPCVRAWRSPGRQYEFEVPIQSGGLPEADAYDLERHLNAKNAAIAAKADTGSNHAEFYMVTIGNEAAFRTEFPQVNVEQLSVGGGASRER